jgi:hypothetical protein
MDVYCWFGAQIAFLLADFVALLLIYSCRPVHVALKFLDQDHVSSNLIIFSLIIFYLNIFSNSSSHSIQHRQQSQLSVGGLKFVGLAE